MRSAAALAALGLLSTWLFAATPQTEDVVTALHAGETLTLHLERQKGAPIVRVGPWRLGTRLKNVAKGRADRISDTRINLYFVVPGDQHLPGPAGYDHNLIVNIAADENQPIERDADLFWVAVLDPKVTQEIRLENDMILLAQESFVPHDLFALDDAPGAVLLRDQLHYESMADLAKYRNEDGSLPRVLIVPAGFVVRVTVNPQPAPPSPASQPK